MGLLGAPRMQLFPLSCPRCSAPMRIIAFVTDVGAIQRIFEHIRELATPPPDRVCPGSVLARPYSSVLVLPVSKPR
jgi:hypothetical protein